MIISPVVVTGGSGGLGAQIVQAFRTHFDNIAYLFPPLSAPCHTELPGHPALRTANVLVLCHAAPPGSTLAESLMADVVLADECVREFVAGQLERNHTGGRIILFSSIRAHHPRPSQVAYAATKSAVEGLTRGLAVALGPRGITVNCIAPGAIETPRTRANLAAGVVSRDELEGRTPLGRLGWPDDVASLVLWLASEESGLMTGQVLTLDGGWSVSG